MWRSVSTLEVHVCSVPVAKCFSTLEVHVSCVLIGLLLLQHLRITVAILLIGFLIHRSVKNCTPWLHSNEKVAKMTQIFCEHNHRSSAGRVSQQCSDKNQAFQNVFLPCRPYAMELESFEHIRKKRRGGHQQRLLATEAEQNSAASSQGPAQAPSALAEWLQQEWAWGRFSPQEVQHIAALSARDMRSAGATNIQPSLSNLSNLGSEGRHPNNVHRDLQALLKDKSSLPEALFVQMPLKNMSVLQAIMLPHLVFHSLFTNYKEYWASSFLPDGQRSLQRFWSNFSSHPCMEGFEGSRPQWQKWTLPIGMHGDAVPTLGCGKVWAKLLQGYSWTCLLSRGTTKQRSFFLWGIFEQILKNGPGGTLDVFFAILAWSFTALYRGKFPDCDWQGNKYAAGSVEQQKAGQWLAGGFCGALISVQGDLDFFAASLQLPRWNLKAGGCSVCKAAQEGLGTWKKFSCPQHILDLEWKPAQWKLWDKKSKCFLFSIPNLSACNIMLDYLHCKYLGSDQYQYGGLLYYMTYFLLPEAAWSNLQCIWSKIKFYYKELKVKHQYHYFNRLTMYVRKTGPPKLRGRGAEVLGLGKVLLHIWRDLHNPSIEIHRMLLVMLKANNNMEEILDEHRYEAALPALAAQRFVDNAFRMAHLQHLIYCHFNDEPLLRGSFAITIKLHMVLHIALHSHEISPRLTWNFTGEDSMGILKTLGQNCSKGVQPQDVCTKMLSHWRYAMHQELTKI